MIDPTGIQVRYADDQRRFAHLNEKGWQFAPLTTQRRFRAMLAHVLLTLAAPARAKHFGAAVAPTPRCIRTPAP